METYRDEIIETQKVRSELLQRKLVLSAVLGGIGLGLRGAGLDEDQVVTSFGLNSHVYLILCLIPLVCAYIDLLCYHLNLRMFVIAKFLKDPRRAINRRKGINKNDQSSSGKDNNNDNDNNFESEDYRLYEKICAEERDAFSLESFALKASSIVLSLLLIVLPFFIELDNQNPLLDDISLSASGIVGIILAMSIEALSNKKTNLLESNEQSVFLGRVEQMTITTTNQTDNNNYNLKSIIKKGQYYLQKGEVFLRKILYQLGFLPSYYYYYQKKVACAKQVMIFALTLTIIKGKKSYPITSSFIQYYEEKILELLDYNKSEEEYQKYLFHFGIIGYWTKVLLFYQNLLIFGIGTLLLVFAYYAKYLANIFDCELSKNQQSVEATIGYCLSDSTLLLQLRSEFNPNFSRFIIAILIIITIFIGILITLFNLQNELKKLKKAYNFSDFKNECYKFLIAKSAKTEIFNLNKKPISSEKYLSDDLKKDSVIIMISLAVFVFIFSWYIFSSLKYTQSIIIDLPYTMDFKSHSLNTLGNRVGLIGSCFIALVSLIPFLNNCFGFYADKINKLKSFLPKELGQIQEEFIAEILFSEDEQKRSRLLHEKRITFFKPHSKKEYNSTKNKTYLLLIKCCDGIAIVNPGNYFISSDEGKILVNESYDQNSVKTGSYWEISFDFPINIGACPENLDKREVKEKVKKITNWDYLDNIQQYQFTRWKRIIDNQDQDDSQCKGIEIGDKTALFFVYTD